MLWRRPAVLLGAILVTSCAPHAEPVQEREPEPPEERQAEAAVEVEPQPEPAQPEPEPEPEPTPLDPDARVTPRLHIEFEGDDGACSGRAWTTNMPAYDPRTEQVVVLDTYQRTMSEDREAVVRWYDAKTGAMLREESLLVGAMGQPCARETRRGVRAVKALNRELREGTWEAMHSVPLRRVHADSYSNFQGAMEIAAAEDATDEDRETAESWAEELMPRGQVHVVDRPEGTVVRLPGVKVYERDVLIAPNTLEALVAHRPTGVVVATHADCRDEEDCTCNLETSTAVMRWAVATLTAIDAHPCALPEDADDDFACVFGSVFE